MNCCDGIIKYLLFAFNLIFSLSGLGLIIAGSILIHKSAAFSDVLNDIKSGFLAPQITLIVLGLIIFVTATLGCCGAIQGNRCKLITYAVFLLSIFVIELSIGIYAVVNIGDIRNLVIKEMRSYFDSMFSYPDRMRVFHDMEKFLQCCGVTGYTDYSIKGQPVPDSCRSPTNEVWKIGCGPAVTDLSTNAGKVVAGLGIVLALLEIVGASFALRLASLVETIY